ncbi:TPA: family 65 glycosyl hydrolase, partial [Candidatus Sumerlaeota bacterium]|nr:family 65 glycosyl hydrolase [Candidatus Sumerlaeota bacterium]
KIAVNHWEKGAKSDNVWENGWKTAKKLADVTYDEARAAHCAFWQDAWDKMDVEIEGDPLMQQGVRYAMFIAFMDYHGEDERKNVLCKLAGEVYNGWNFWDTEV